MSSSQEPNGPTQASQQTQPEPSFFKRVIAFVSTPLSQFAAWTWVKVKSAPTVAVAGVLLVATLIFLFRTAIWDFAIDAKDGQIIVNSPTVYTRQRLVNDRLEQARWLKSQLDETEIEKGANFKIVDQIHSTAATNAIGVGTSTPDKVTPPAITNKVEPTTTAIFRAKNAYRDEVRSEITQTELDDRHDIDGNTILRLSFDASIVAGTKRDSVAAVVVSLTHDTKTDTGENPYESDYRALYQDWIRYFQSQLRKTLRSVPYSFLTSEPYPPLRMLFSDFLLRRICHFVIEPSKERLFAEVSSCSDDGKTRAEAMLQAFTDSRGLTLSKWRDNEFSDQLERYRARDYKFPLLLSSEDIYRQAYNNCAGDPGRDQIPLANLSIKNTEGDDAQETIDCPYIDSLKQRIHAGILLYESILSSRQSDQISAGDYATASKIAVKDLGACEKEKCKIPPWAIKCFVADFLKSTLNALGQNSPTPQQKTDHFLQIDITGRNIHDCDLAVSNRIGRYPVAEHAGQTPEEKKRLQEEKNLLNEFVSYLNQGSDAFAYSVTPKSLTENISTAAETRDAYAAIFRAPSGGKEVANFLKQRSDQNQGIVSHPIIVGFGSAAKKVPASKAIPPMKAVPLILDFGWIIAPRSRGLRYEQIDGQYPLTVYVSAPAWWRSVKAEIQTCWLSRKALAGVKGEPTAANICGADAQRKREMTVRLPTAVAEISRKLAFDVLQEPSFYDVDERELTVGAQGLLLLEGARLWRSTDVTAGAQHASRITVLPNMEGILAEFECVRPPNILTRFTNPTMSGDPEAVTRDWIRVWTSEGVTEKMPVKFVWPKYLLRDEKAVKDLCPDKKAPPASSEKSLVKVVTQPEGSTSTPPATPPPAGTPTPKTNPPVDAALTAPAVKPPPKP
jgi:hypothetical protein